MKRKLMRNNFRFSIIHVSPAYFSHLEVVISGNIGIELDICGVLFLQVTIEVLNIGNMNLARGGTVSRKKRHHT